MNQALAGGLAPYLSLAVKKATEGDPTANIAGHALAGAVIAYLQGGSVSGGAAGAAGGELAARAIMAEIYPGRSVESLSNDEKSNISALSTLAAGLAGGVAGNSLNAAGTGAVGGKVAVENNFLSQGSPRKYAEKYKKCNGEADCEQNIRKDMARESAENVQKLKSCWDAGDATCVADTRSKIELDEKAYTELRQQDNMAGRAYEDSAKWYADIIDQCAGKCDWLEAALLKTGADGLGNLVYGALGAGSLTGGKPGSATIAESSGERGAIPNTSPVLKLGETAIINEVKVTRVGRWMSPDELAQMQNGGKVVQGGGGQTFISTNGITDFKATAPAGSVYVEFDVPTNSLLQGGKDGWFKLIGPDASKSQKFMLNKQGGSQLPDAKNITVLGKK
ncbi:MAG: VENN motif pre-toxin domain-containing protein [Ewingella sp.]|uniref:VENN motif pre-toxin domain-containing protein n=1 Tax=Ewingella TaxID=41201 RepID=UPI0033654600